MSGESFVGELGKAVYFFLPGLFALGLLCFALPFPFGGITSRWRASRALDYYTHNVKQLLSRVTAHALAFLLVPYYS